MLASNHFLHLIPDKSYDENKQKAQKPNFDLKKLDAFPKAYDNYYRDHFSLRGLFLDINRTLKTQVFKTQVNPERVIQGKDNHLYNVDKELDLYLAKNRFTDEELKSFASILMERQEYYKSKNADFYFVILPTKYTAEPQYLPWFVFKPEEKNRSHQLVDYLKKNCSVPIIDVREAFNSIDTDSLYFKFDNHWSAYGSFVGYQYVIDALRKDHPSLPNYKISDFELEPKFRENGNLSGAIAARGTFTEYDYIPKAKFTSKFIESDTLIHDVNPDNPYKDEFQMSYTSGETNRPNVLIIRDSYTRSTIDFLPHYFNRCTYIFDEWHYGENQDITEKENPDIVLLSVLESLTHNVLQFNGQ